MNREAQAVTDRAALVDVLDSALICHLGVDVGHPLVLPTAFGYDLDGPDEGGTLYVHGSVASHSLVQARSQTLCITLTVLDGLIAARSAFHHSMNYRSAVVIGEARQVTDDDERRHALALIVDHMIPGRSATLRPHLRKELAATGVIAVPLHEASVKARSGGPVDEPDDYESVGGWAGEIFRCVSSLTCRFLTSRRSETSPRGRGPRSARSRLRTRLRAHDAAHPGPLQARRRPPRPGRRVLSRFEAKGLTIVAIEHRTDRRELADRHYDEHTERDFYPPLRRS